MKKFLLAAIIACMMPLLPVDAQDNEIQQDTLRNFSVKIVDRKGKPMPNLVISRLRQDQSFLTDKKGSVLLEGICDKDSLVVFLPNIGETHIPCEGLDSILITVRSKKRFRVEDRKELASRRTTPTNSIENVPELLKTRPARDLAELLMGQIPGLRITSGPNGVTANIRGLNTITGNTEPLIVVDGMTYDTFSVVNSFLDVHSIQSIQVQKDGGMYGMRGANGVIIITTKGASANPLSY
ncbi:MAG TPA: TonB-dependent receptor plug domain-containing protein [Bacteroidales bacterium]|nr:TonB-dependent receptor plug domain-containing protein [Bacteroidales bacterium]HRW94479.1 TonB-dependent receptor plug domain-containing protein [Bacteroidales bacterium]